MFVTPAVVGDRVLVGSCDGVFHGIDLGSGASVWRHVTAEDGALGQVHGDGLVVDGHWIVGSHGRFRGNVYSFAPDTGEVRWLRRLGKGTGVRLHQHGDTVLAVSMEGAVSALDLATGEVRWRLDGPDGGGTYYTGDPLLAGDRLVVPRSGGVVDAVDAATGELLWRAALDAELWTSVVPLDGELDGELVVGTRDGRLLRLSPDDGALLGAFDPGDPGGFFHGYLGDGGSCVVALQAGGMGERGELSGPHSVACLRPATGEVVWERRSEDEWTALRPLILDGTVVVGTGGRLQGLDLADGRLLWEREIGDLTPRGLGAADGRLFVGIKEGHLLALPWGDSPRLSDH